MRRLDPSQRSWLMRELEIWQQQELVSADQVLGILDQYESEEEARARRGSRGLFVLTGLAMLLVALAVLLLISYNWQDMPRGLKLALIVGAVISAHGVGWRLLGRQNEGGAEIAFFFGSLLYGAGIFLVAQVFHFSAHYPDGFLWWSLGVLPFALVARTLLPHVLYGVLLAIWCSTEIVGFSDSWLLGYLPNGAYALPFLSLPGLAWAYHRRSTMAVALYAALMTWWACLQPSAWDAIWNIDWAASFYFIGAVAGLLLLIANRHRSGHPLARPYHLYGGLLAVGTLAPLSFLELHKEIEEDFGPLEGAPTVIVLLLGWVIWRVFGRRSEETADAPWRLGVPGVVLGTMTLGVWWHIVAKEPYLPTILSHLTMLLLAWTWLRHGLQTDRGLPFSSGVGLFLLWTVLRYVDLFGDVGGMLGASLMFFLCGTILFAVALYWRRRKELSP